MKRVNRSDAIAVAEALIYDPGCGRCTEEYGGPHEGCAIAARDRILEAALDDA